MDGAVDRFGKTKPGTVRQSANATGPTPGPGAYHREAERETASISSSAFMSGSAAHPDTNRDAIPGPAYYAPASVPEHRSYHLNAVQRWMPN